MLAEGLVTLLELGGPEAAMDQITEMAGKDALGLIETVLESGHPSEVSMEELRTLVAEPMRARAHRLRFANTPAPGSRGRRSGHGKRHKR
ncbi:hypothetical protein N5079_14585 [Planotetraspora sp. A-T 1434]|uniref:hypothetical protein n=1 Tax=Planotetraspora sp. A-T 1434 TaxID=2979219 RepID=UPI0021C1333C|nr:hypothetical protein [Planotetraspora sp. A-T 1434]MCT9931445.1 hypothetical protein [Planotetraspora sp. A-T 1434]